MFEAGDASVFGARKDRLDPAVQVVGVCDDRVTDDETHHHRANVGTMAVCSSIRSGIRVRVIAAPLADHLPRQCVGPQCEPQQNLGEFRRALLMRSFIRPSRGRPEAALARASAQPNVRQFVGRSAVGQVRLGVDARTGSAGPSAFGGGAPWWCLRRREPTTPRCPGHS